MFLDTPNFRYQIGPGETNRSTSLGVVCINPTTGAAGPCTSDPSSNEELSQVATNTTTPTTTTTTTTPAAATSTSWFSGSMTIGSWSIPNWALLAGGAAALFFMFGGKK